MLFFHHEDFNWGSFVSCADVLPIELLGLLCNTHSQHRVYTHINLSIGKGSQ